MKISITSFFAFIALFIGMCVKADAFQKSSDKESEVLEAVAKLPEVREFLKKHSKQKALLLLQGEPARDRKFYWVALGFSDLDMFRTASNFYVNPKNYKVYFIDPLVDSGSDIISINQWRKLRNKKEFGKMHIYKSGKLIALKD